jgi:hypothetical protein
VRLHAVCDIYRRWLGRRQLTTCKVHRGGEKGLVDYADKTPRLTDAATGSARRNWALTRMATFASGSGCIDRRADEGLSRCGRRPVGRRRIPKRRVLTFHDWLHGGYPVGDLAAKYRLAGRGLECRRRVCATLI